jgi:leader peptidase (prepilin peptidase)/N-methyltransferase
VLVPVVVAAAVAGAGWGFLVPGLVDRFAVPWPDGAPRPRWRRSCRHCGADRRHWWLMSGRCRACGHRPSPGRTLTVPLSAAAWALVAAGVGADAALPAFLVLAAVAVPLALVDVTVLRLPDPLVATAFGAGVVLLAAVAVTTGTPGRLLRAAGAAAACGALYLLLALLPGSGMGFGDVKLGAVLGWYLGWLGWFAVVLGVVLTPLVNLPFLVAALANRDIDRRKSMPYGPAMLLAAVLATVLTGLR